MKIHWKRPVTCLMAVILSLSQLVLPAFPLRQSSSVQSPAVLRHITQKLKTEHELTLDQVLSRIMTPQALDALRRRGAFVFDVDGTLLSRKQSLDQQPELLVMLAALLRQGVRIAVISGNSFDDIKSRIVEPLRVALRHAGALQALANLKVYADASTSKFSFDEQGEAVEDREYGQQFTAAITDQEFRTIQGLLTLKAHQQFGLTADEVDKWVSWYAEAPAREFNKRFELPWAQNEFYVPPIVPAVVVNNKDGATMQAPWIETRGRTLAIKLLPRDPRDIRFDLIAGLRASQELARPCQLFDIRPGGFASIDFAASKSVALRDLIRSWQFEPSAVYYVGDEFFLGEAQTASGNDLSIFDPQEGYDPATLNVLAVNDAERPPQRDIKALWIGSGPQATLELLRRLVLSDRWLIGQSLEDGTVITDEMLASLRGRMGVKDLVASQRIVDDPHGALNRARRAVARIHRDLKGRGLDATTITQEQFSKLVGVRPVVMVAGYATRFSVYLHKSMARAGLRNTNVAYALDGAYTTPGTKPIVVVNDKVLGLIVQDEYLVDYDEMRHAFLVNPQITQLSTGERAKRIDPSVLDPEKVQVYFSRAVEDLEFVYAKPFGYGDHLIQAVKLVTDKAAVAPAYTQVAFGEMSPAALEHFSNPSFASYLEIVGSGADAVAGGKPSRSQIEGKGHFFFTNGTLYSYTDWEYLPYKQTSDQVDRVAMQFADQQRAVEEALAQLPSDAGQQRLGVQKLRAQYPYFAISDDGVLFSQETLVAVREELRQWDGLPAERKAWLRRHFAIHESPDGRSADLLISSNTGIFRTEVLRELNDEIGRLYEDGQFNRHEPGQAPDPRQVNIFWGIDPKNGETTTTAWHLVRILFDQAQRKGRSPNLGFLYVGNAPSSIKDPTRQFEFVTQSPPDWHRPPTWHPPLGDAERQVVDQVTQQLIDSRPDDALRPSVLALDHRVIRALLARSTEKHWQAGLLRVLAFLQEEGQAEGHSRKLKGEIELLVAEAVDAGQIGGNPNALMGDREYVGEILRLRNTYAVSARTSGRSEYLLERFAQILAGNVRRGLEARKTPGITQAGLEFAQAEIQAELANPERSLDSEEFLALCNPQVWRRMADLLVMVGGDHEALRQAIRVNQQVTVTSLATLVLENQIPAFVQADRHSPDEDPEAFLFVGGTGGHMFTGVIPLIIESTPPMRMVRLNTVVGLSPFDDGGGSRKVMDMFEPSLGPIPPPGDEINVMSGLTKARKRWVLRYRTGREDTGSLKAKVLEVLTQAYTGRDAQGRVIPELEGEPMDADWPTFSHHLLMVAELLDEGYFMNEEKLRARDQLIEGRQLPETARLTIAGNSIGNFFNVGMKLYTGAYSEATGQIDPKKYSQAIQYMCALLGVPDVHVVPSSFVKGTLYARLEALAITIGTEEVVLDQQRVDQGSLQIGGVDVVLGRTDQGHLTITINGQQAVIRESVVGIQDDTGRELDRVVLDTQGHWRELTIGGVQVRIRIKDWLVIEQTNITEHLHLAPIVELGLIKGVMPHANPEFVRLLENSQDILIMGPGSAVTSLLPELLSPEIVKALVKRRREGIPSLFVFNPFQDNETVNQGFLDIVRLIERTASRAVGSPVQFEELFSAVLVNDLVGSARQAVDSREEQRIRDVLRLIEMMDELALKQGDVKEARSPTDFSKLAKLSRGVMGARQDELDQLRREIERRHIPSTFEFDQIRTLGTDMERRGVKVYLRPLATLIGREVRQAGAAGREEAVGYDRDALAEVIDEILLESSRRWPVYQELKEVFGGDASSLDLETQRMMALFPTWTRRRVLEQMRQWWIEQQWPEGTPLITPDEIRWMPFPKVIVANVAYTLIWLDGQHRAKPAPPRLICALNDYLAAGGVLVALSGFSWMTMHANIFSQVDYRLRHRIVVAPSTGAEAWGYDKDGNPVRLYSLVDEITTQLEREKLEVLRHGWSKAVEQVYREFELDQPLYSLTGRLLDPPVILDDREWQITLETVGRTNLSRGVAEQINRRLRGHHLGTYLITQVEGYYDIRIPLIHRLNDILAERFGDQRLPIKVVPTRVGSGAINLVLQSTREGVEKLLQQGVIERVTGKPVTTPDFLFLGRRKEELAEQFPDTTFVTFQLYGPPEAMPAGLHLYQGPPGIGGVVELMEGLVSRPDVRGGEVHLPSAETGRLSLISQHSL